MYTPMQASIRSLIAESKTRCRASSVKSNYLVINKSVAKATELNRVQATLDKTGFKTALPDAMPACSK